MTELKSLSKNIVQRSCPNHCWKSAIGKGAHLNSCQTMAKQTGRQKHLQIFKTKKSVSMCYLETYREDAIQNTVKLLLSENPCQNVGQKVPQKHGAENTCKNSLSKQIYRYASHFGTGQNCCRKLRQNLHSKKTALKCFSEN